MRSGQARDRFPCRGAGFEQRQYPGEVLRAAGAQGDDREVDRVDDTKRDTFEVGRFGRAQGARVN